MTKAKIQPFCEKYNINLGVHNVDNRKILPAADTQKRIGLFVNNNTFCVI